MTITDEDFEDAVVSTIRYRLHPLDVGFDLRHARMVVAVDLADDPIRVSYPRRDGARRVMSGPQAEVLGRLRELGFAFDVDTSARSTK